MAASWGRNNDDFQFTLRKVYQFLQTQCQTTNVQNEIALQQGGFNILAVWTDLEGKLSARHLRSSIGRMIGVENFNIVQVVGDCGTKFTNLGMVEAKKIILPFLVNDAAQMDTTTTILEYGYTASDCDVNWIVNDIVASTPGLAARTVANIVHMSIEAVESGQCVAIPDVRNMVLAYNVANTVFGSDMWLSDSVMSGSSGDTLICVEGGPQSFAQAVNTALAGVRVIAVTGPCLRETSLAPSFSAAELLRRLQYAISAHAVQEGHSMVTAVNMIALGTAYMDKVANLGEGASRRGIVTAALQRINAQPEALKAVHIRSIEAHDTVFEV